MTSHNRCLSCGQAGRRKCPALGGLICTACCGSGRGSKYACPAECGYYPFGTTSYDLWLKTDLQWIKKTLDYMANHIDRQTYFEASDRLGVPSTKPGDRTATMETGAQHATSYFLFIHRDDQGRTVADKWEAESWAGLNNDERVMMKYRRTTRPAILEIQKIVNDQAMVCIDLLDPDRGIFTVFDRSTVAMVAPFSRTLTWVAHYPHFSRLAGGGLEIAHHIYDSFVTELEHVAKKATRKKGSEGIRLYLWEHFGEACQLLTDMCLAYRDNAFRSLDADMCLAFYDIKGDREAILAVLRAKPDFAEDDDILEANDPPGTQRFAWYRIGEAHEFEKTLPSIMQHNSPKDGRGILGTIKLRENELVLQTMGRKKFDFAMKLLKKYCGANLVYRSQQIEDLVEALKKREHDRKTAPIDYDDDLPESGPASQDKIPLHIQQSLQEQFCRRHYEKFIDDPVPKLLNATPRQAAKDPKLRPLLVDLMKEHLHNLAQNRRSQGVDIRIDWLLKELGLSELL